MYNSTGFSFSPPQQQTSQFHDRLIDEIFSTLAPSLGREERKLITHSKSPEGISSKIAKLWQDVKPDYLNSSYALDYQAIWQRIKDEPYTISWPIINAMYFSEGVDNITRKQIIIRNSANINRLNDSLFTEPLPVYDVLTPRALDSLSPRDRSVLATRTDTPTKILHNLAKDRFLWSVLASNTGIDEVIMAKLVESQDLYIYRNLIKNKNLTSHMVDFIWKEAKGKDVSLIAELAFHRNASYHLIKTLDSPSLDLSLAESLLNAYANKDTKKKFLSKIVFNIIRNAQKSTSEGKDAKWLRDDRVNVLLRKLAFSNHITVNEWFSYLSEDHGSNIKSGLIIKKTIIRSLEFGNNLETFCNTFKEEQGIDISGYTVSMIEEMLGLEESAEAQW
jgi:hypothetical protein